MYQPADNVITTVQNISEAELYLSEKSLIQCLDISMDRAPLMKSNFLSNQNKEKIGCIYSILYTTEQG